MGLTALAVLAAALTAAVVGLGPSGAGRIRRRLHGRHPSPSQGVVAVGGSRRVRRRSRPGRPLRPHPRLAPVAALGRCLMGGWPVRRGGSELEAPEPCSAGSESGDEILIGGAALALPAAAAAIGPLPALVGLAAVIALVRLRARRRRLDHQRRVESGLPEVVDLLGLLMGAGQPTAPALAAIGPRSPEPFQSEFADVVRRSSAGESFSESMRRMRDRLGPAAAPLVHALLAAEVDGVPLGPALARVGDEARRRRRVRAEEAARRVPVLMLFPLVFCVLPAFGLLTVVPLMVGSIADLQLPVVP